jgi:hypothetical protein
MTWVIPPMFAGQTVAVLASGPSMSQAVADRVRHLPRIAINSTYRLAPDADVIYASDSMWWQRNPEALQCAGIKACVEAVRDIPPNVPDAVRVLRNTGREGFDPNPGCVRTLLNSGGVGIQIAVHARAARILLLGFDMRGGHWHPQHERPLGNPGAALFARWIGYINGLSRQLTVEVLNCTPGSALTCFPVVSLEDALDARAAA